MVGSQPRCGLCGYPDRWRDYSPLENNINFPAGILQTSFYNAATDAAVNYGGARDQALRVPALEIRAAGQERLFIGWNCEQPRDFHRAAALQDIIKEIEPFARFNGVELSGVSF